MEKKMAAVHGEGFPSNYATNADKGNYGFTPIREHLWTIRVEPV